LCDFPWADIGPLATTLVLAVLGRQKANLNSIYFVSTNASARPDVSCRGKLESRRAAKSILMTAAELGCAAAGFPLTDRFEIGILAILPWLAGEPHPV
jgi:hypothetical protein